MSMPMPRMYASKKNRQLLPLSQRKRPNALKLKTLLWKQSNRDQLKSKLLSLRPQLKAKKMTRNPAPAHPLPKESKRKRKRQPKQLRNPQSSPFNNKQMKRPQNLVHTTTRVLSPTRSRSRRPNSSNLKLISNTLQRLSLTLVVALFSERLENRQHSCAL